MKRKNQHILQKTKKSLQKTSQWKNIYTVENTEIEKKQMISVRNFCTTWGGECQLPIELSELLFSETNKYVSQKENHTLDLKKQKLRSFIAVIILRGILIYLDSLCIGRWQRIFIIALLRPYLQEADSMKFWRICTWLITITSITVRD